MAINKFDKDGNRLLCCKKNCYNAIVPGSVICDACAAENIIKAKKEKERGTLPLISVDLFLDPEDKKTDDQRAAQRILDRQLDDHSTTKVAAR